MLTKKNNETKRNRRHGKRPDWLRSLAAIPKDLSSVLSTSICKSSFLGAKTLLRLLRTDGTHEVHIHAVEKASKKTQKQ